MDGLGLHHEFLLCSLHDSHGSRLLYATWDSYGLAGALVSEMQLRDRLVAVKANTFALRSGPLSRGALGAAESRLADKELSLERCIGTVCHQWFSSIAPLRRAALDELVGVGILERAQDTFLFVPWRMRYPQVDATVEAALRARLRRHIATAPDSEPPGKDDLLVSLLRGTKLLESVWSDREIEALKPRIDHRTDRAPIGRTVKELVEAAQAAAAAAGAAFGSPHAALD